MVYVDELLESVHAGIGDWVLVKGITETMPYVVCYHAAEVIYDGSGHLDVDLCMRMDHNKIESVSILEKNSNLVSELMHKGDK